MTISKFVQASIWIFLVGIILFGGWKTIQFMIQRNQIKNNGTMGIAIIEKIWRSRCGSSYANSGYIRLTKPDTSYLLHADCNISNYYSEGDTLLIAFLESDPTKFIILNQ